MAQIDVSDLMTDPDFVDAIQIIHRTQSVNSRGEAVILEDTVDSVGSVQPANAKTMQRLPESLRVENLSSFWIKGVVTAASGSNYPDILVFGGKRYQVKSISDWSNFGQGYSEGVCVVEDLTS